MSKNRQAYSDAVDVLQRMKDIATEREVRRRKAPSADPSTVSLEDFCADVDHVCRELRDEKADRLLTCAAVVRLMIRAAHLGVYDAYESGVSH
ncbi:MAG: hypothetical protein IH986_02355 [Planctomycetes bacterium]|nr:hypothetical protein [Planctomycetota bacterium]